MKVEWNLRVSKSTRLAREKAIIRENQIII